MSSRVDSTYALATNIPPRSSSSRWTPLTLLFQAYDSHCNLVLGDVEETVYVVDDEAEDEEIKTVSKKSEMLFVRGRFRRPTPGFYAC